MAFDPINIIEYFYPVDSPLRRLLILHSSQVCRKALEIAAASGIELDLEIVKNGATLALKGYAKKEMKKDRTEGTDFQFFFNNIAYFFI